jgi:hypothetical protein
MNDLHTRIVTLPMSKTELVRCFTELQRCYLELTAYLDYMTIYEPRMDGSRPPATRVEDTYGTFTSDPLVVQNFVTAGLPVWFIRPISRLPDTRIDNITPLLLPTSLKFDDATPKFPTVF